MTTQCSCLVDDVSFIRVDICDVLLIVFGMFWAVHSKTLVEVYFQMGRAVISSSVGISSGAPPQLDAQSQTLMPLHIPGRSSTPVSDTQAGVRSSDSSVRGGMDTTRVADTTPASSDNAQDMISLAKRGEFGMGTALVSLY